MDKIELRDILISWLVLSLAFMIATIARNENKFLVELVLSLASMIATRAFSLELLATFLFIVGVSIITHEFAHRQVAKRLRFDARYQAWPFGLTLALLSSFAGFIFAAPGAVYISPRYVFHESRERLREANFKISVAGPGTNILLGVLFIGLLFTFPIQLFYFAAWINIWLAIFNLIPFPPLDGSKIFSYDVRYWGIMIASAGALFVLLGGFRF